ncbi:hypothetical protein JCM6882_008125 [Rhodosporidiobolus microsporus]
MPPDPSAASNAAARARAASAPYPAASAATPAQSPSEDGGDAPGADKERRNSTTDARRHLSCENCRVRKMKCSRQSPCLSCRMRGDECIWIGQAPNGSADEDELESSANEVARLKRLVDLLLQRLEEQDAQAGPAASDSPPASAAATPATTTTDGAYSHHPPAPQQAQNGGVVLPGAGSPLSEPRHLPGPPPSLGVGPAAISSAAGGPPSARDIPVHAGPPPPSAHPYANAPHHPRYPHSHAHPHSPYGPVYGYGPPYGGGGAMLDYGPPVVGGGYGSPHLAYGAMGGPGAYRGGPYGPPPPGREYWGP